MKIVSTVDSRALGLNKHTIDDLCGITQFSHQKLVARNEVIIAQMDEDLAQYGLLLDKKVCILGDDPTGAKSNQWDTLHKYFHLESLRRMYHCHQMGLYAYKCNYSELVGELANHLSEGLASVYRDGIAKNKALVVGERIDRQHRAQSCLFTQECFSEFTVYSPSAVITRGIGVKIKLGQIDPTKNLAKNNIIKISIEEIVPKPHFHLMGLVRVGQKKTGNLNLTYRHTAGTMVSFDVPVITSDQKALVSRMKKTIKAIK